MTDAAALKSDASNSAFPWAKRGSARCKSKETVMCCAFSADDTLLVVGFYDGTVACFDLHTLGVRHESVVGRSSGGKAAAITAIAVRPTRGGAKPGYLIATTNGDLLRMDTQFSITDSVVDSGGVIYSCDYSADGVFFATAGHDAVIRVYKDAHGGQLVQEVRLAPEYATNVAALRLFSVRFDPEVNERYYAAGWGNTIHAHRVSATPEEKPTELFGAYVTGEALDVRKGVVISASHRLDDAVQLWDTDTHKPTTIPWPVKHRFLPSCARLSCDGRFVGVGGAGGEGLDAGFFAVDLSSGKPVIDVKVDKAVTACAFAHAEALVAFCDGEGHVQVYENRFANRTAAGSAVAAVRA
uniref:Guanine nucleotide-binding protein subunit beta-like protein n=1 Tax=Neobodo designis TaxID=312471 RepID=A0A7S1L3E9_NEODS|mmetsp:Transcript_13962/g.43482  ORF Transcript_13962/g.43482 Transcript_13962/m.43482 type:complete len:355 (+) Transcript_13962:48-1112(+)